MPPRIYSPFHQLPFDETVARASLEEQIEAMNVTDEQLVQYSEAYLISFRDIVDEFFPQFNTLLLHYHGQPFHTTIVRLGKNGVIIVRRRSSVALTEVKPMAEFSRPDGTSNIFDLTNALQAEYCWFDSRPCDYSEEDARARAIVDVLSGILEFFWQLIPSGDVFEEICRKLIEAEGVRIEIDSSTATNTSPIQFDATGTVVLDEPAGYRRVETWGFEFKHISAGRVSAAYLHDIETTLGDLETPDVVCLLTPDDLTSIGRYLSVENPRLRVWDRVVLNRIANQHLNVLRDYFEAYPSAVEELSRRLSHKSSEVQERAEVFAGKLQACPTGNSSFAKYEEIGIEILIYLFGDQLGPAKPQVRTVDGKQRRDVLFRNNRSSSLFERLFLRFDADSLIVDFKNYGAEIEPEVITDVDKYANKALVDSY